MISSVIATCHGSFNILRQFDFRNQRRLSYLPSWRRKVFSWACMTWTACMSGISGSGLCSSVSVLLWKVSLLLLTMAGIRYFAPNEYSIYPEQFPFWDLRICWNFHIWTLPSWILLRFWNVGLNAKGCSPNKGNCQSPMAMYQFLLQICVQVLLYSCLHFLSKVV